MTKRSAPPYLRIVKTLEIEEARIADIPRLLEIRHTAFAKHAPIAYSDEEVKTLLADIDEAELEEMIRARQLFVACKENTIIGLAGWKGSNLRHVYVDPDETRRGVGTALVRHVELDFKARTGSNEIKAGVGLQAVAFYESNGYQLLSREKAWDGSDYLLMGKKL